METEENPTYSFCLDSSIADISTICFSFCTYQGGRVHTCVCYIGVLQTHPRVSYIIMAIYP